MADPFTIISVVSCALSLTLKCVSAAKGLHELAERFKQAELDILSTAQQCDIIRLAWQRIGLWCEHWAEPDETLLSRLTQSLDLGDRVLSALEADLAAFQKPEKPNSFRRRSRIVWNQKLFHVYQARVNDQVGALGLLLMVLELPTTGGRDERLRQYVPALHKSDESAWTIVPSQMSLSCRSSTTVTSLESTDLLYRPLSFEDDLFTGRVYKRNFVASMTQRAPKPKLEADKHGSLPNAENTTSYLPLPSTAKEQPATFPINISQSPLQILELGRERTSDDFSRILQLDDRSSVWSPRLRDSWYQ